MLWRLLAICLIALTGCGGQQALPHKASDASPALTYVALGDSYTAAPYVVNTDLAQGCLRSHTNYPRLVAKALRADLTDVSCGGAESVNVTVPQRTFGSESVRPQIEAVSSDADLITVGLGGNDGELFSKLSVTCPITGPDGNRLTHGNRCGHVDGFLSPSLFKDTEAGLVKMLRTVRAKAPDAEILLIGYPRLLGDEGCKKLPVAEADVDATQRVAVQLQRAQRAAARTTGVTFVDMHTISRGHDACSADPWVNGVDTDQHRGAALHPTLAGQKAVAEQVERAVKDHLADPGS